MGEGFFADCAVTGLHEFDIVAVGDLRQVAVLVSDLTEFQVRVVEHGEDGVCRVGDLAHLSQNVFLRLGQHVLFFAKYVLDDKAVLGQGRLFLHVSAQGFFWRGKQLRREEAHGGADLGDHSAHFVVHGLLRSLAVVLVQLHAGVDICPLQLLPDSVFCLQRFSQRPGAFCKPTSVAAKVLCHGEDLLDILLPAGRVGIHLFYFPFIFLVYFISVF